MNLNEVGMAVKTKQNRRMEKVGIISRCTVSCWEKLKLGISCNYQTSPLPTRFPGTQMKREKVKENFSGSRFRFVGKSPLCNAISNSNFKSGELAKLSAENINLKSKAVGEL